MSRSSITVSVVLSLAFLVLLAFFVTIMRSRREKPESGLARGCRKVRQALERRRSTFRAPFRKRLAARCREVLGTPLSVPGDGEPLTDAEKSVLAGYIVAEQENRPLAPEPRHRRLP